MIARRMAFAGMLLCSVVLGGCPRRPCPERSVSLVELVDQHNANASRIRKLWARARIRVTLSDESGLRLAWGSTSALAPSNGYVMLSKEPVFSPSGPGPSDRVNFVLIGREMSDLFRLGLDARSGLYYFWYRLGDRGEAWYGRTEYAGAPKAESMPIDPTQLVDQAPAGHGAPEDLAGGLLPLGRRAPAASFPREALRSVRPMPRDRGGRQVQAD